jgi:GGDEF domain-containing protein
VSIGVAMIHHRESYESVFKRADAALYKAKRNIRPGYGICRPLKIRGRFGFEKNMLIEKIIAKNSKDLPLPESF